MLKEDWGGRTGKRQERYCEAPREWKGKAGINGGTQDEESMGRYIKIVCEGGIVREFAMMMTRNISTIYDIKMVRLGK